MCFYANLRNFFFFFLLQRKSGNFSFGLLGLDWCENPLVDVSKIMESEDCSDKIFIKLDLWPLDWSNLPEITLDTDTQPVWLCDNNIPLAFYGWAVNYTEEHYEESSSLEQSVARFVAWKQSRSTGLARFYGSLSKWKKYIKRSNNTVIILKSFSYPFHSLISIHDDAPLSINLQDLFFCKYKWVVKDCKTCCQHKVVKTAQSKSCMLAYMTSCLVCR